ncbi:MAG: hypothetical protein WCI36_02550 [bacterium]
MNEIPCLGLNFLAKCSQSNYTDHFLFNLETAVSSLAIIVAIYALLLERRFRVRIEIKEAEQKLIIRLVLLVVGFTFIGATLPYAPGTPLPLIGYPIFWEIVAFLILLYVIFQAYDLIQPVRVLTKKRIAGLKKCAHYDTLSYHGSVDLIVKEADYFWSDLLHKSLGDGSLKRMILEDFTKEDFLKIAIKSQYILMQTVEFIGKANSKTDVANAKEFLKTFVLASLIEDDSIISVDVKSSYKPIMQHIIRKRKLADVIFGNSIDLFFLRQNLGNNQLEVLNKFVEIFRLYLGWKYHHTEDSSNYIELIEVNVLENFLKLFKESLCYLDYDQKTAFMHKLVFMFPELNGLPQEKSEILANGIYEILEEYAGGRDWSKDSQSERLLCIELVDSFVDCNIHTKKVFKQRLLEKIAGTSDDKKITHFVYNLKGFYPMMIPVYFFTYGNDLFSKQLPEEDIEFHMEILRKMQENIPKIAKGHMREFMDVALPEDERGMAAIRLKAEKCIADMFPQDIFYNKEENSITYVFGNEIASKTLLLNETIKKGEVVFKK